ncbi:MAG: hypothetical protein CL521_00515 [Actinobacteria bacterium]|nr:hypothetical protein [Actinomycetota bacterium]|tara:strand:- start:65 stop:415 length:351 start_codon:yes stop_codon:yes gene_type:complete
MTRLWGVLIGMFLAMPVTAQIDYMPLMDYRDMQGSQMSRQDRKKLSEELQVYFLQTIFTKNMFQNSAISLGDVGDESIISSSAGTMSFVNDFFAKEMARKLAKQDVLGLNAILGLE